MVSQNLFMYYLNKIKIFFAKTQSDVILKIIKNDLQELCIYYII